MAPNHCNSIVIWCKGSHLDIGWDLAEKHQKYVQNIPTKNSEGPISKLDIKQLIVALSLSFIVLLSTKFEIALQR